nr:probable glucan 1,3-alpha-glucosidase [Ipomoea batatas]
MVSELAGEGAVPPQLPAPASRSLEIAHHSLSDYELDHIDEKNRNLSRVLFDSSHSWSRSMEILSRVLTNRLFTTFNRGKRSRSVEISSRVLVDPMFPVFDRNSRSRAVESTSTMLVSQPSIVDSVYVGRLPAITIQNSTLLEKLQLVKKSKKNKPAGGSIARDLDECRRGLFDVILKLINDVSELFGDPERHQQSRRECVAVIETCVELSVLRSLILVFDKLNDMVVLLPVSKTGKAKAKEGDDVNVKVKEKERTTLISSGLFLCFTTHTESSITSLFNQNCFAAKVVYHVDSKFNEHDILYDVLRLDAEHTDFTWEDVLQFSVYLIVPVSLTSILS